MNSAAYRLTTVVLLVCIVAFGTVSAQASPSLEPLAPTAATRKVYIPVVNVSGVTHPAGESLLENLNYYRTAAGIPKLTENAEWSNGAWLHARYMVKNDIVQHDEAVGNPWYTPEGALAAQKSNLIATSTAGEGSDAWALNSWMGTPFHAVGLLDPQLLQTAYGAYHEAGTGIVWAAAMDVLRGRGDLPAGIQFPLLYPARNSVTDVRYHWPEYPEPLSACPGYTMPSGAPVIVQVGAGSKSPQVTHSSFASRSTPLEHCVFTESTYVNSDAAQQNMGRSLLNDRDAVVLMPRQPLQLNTTYDVSLTIDGATYSWSFTVGAVQ